jgi:hypothetical protein
MFLYAYGFAVEDNEDDTFSVKLMSATNVDDTCGRNAVSCVGNYYIGSGGMDGIPPVSTHLYFVLMDR